MFRATSFNRLPAIISKRVRLNSTKAATSATNLPKSADVVIIGGGSAGCNALYFLAKRGIRAVLLERSKLTSGTTWHTGGLVWRLRPNDVDTELLARTTKLMNSLEAETGQSSGFINNGGLFIAHTPERVQEYQRLSTFGRVLGIESHVMSATDVQKEVFPLLDPNAFLAGLYSPTDGVVDPAQLCSALTKAARQTMPGTAVLEDCEVQEILTATGLLGDKQVTGVRTAMGDIATSAVINATGVWGRDLIKHLDLPLPLIPMRHAYVISEPIEGVHGMPNVRDHDASTYFRIQGSSIHLGGYEANPIILDNVETDFSFRLYDLDWSTFDEHVRHSTELCPALGRHGIRSTVCGPESFTPDHKPLMGPDPRLSGLFHSCGYNSAGMMFGGGCGEQIAHWVEHGRPELNMFSFDVRRFLPSQMAAHSWATARSHEAYAKNYSMVFKNDQPLAGRNLIRDALHERMVERGAFMEERQGCERPGFFLRDGRRAETRPYDYYGYYGNNRHEDYEYERVLGGDCSYTTSAHEELIKAESLACRTNAALFNLSYFSKFLLTGPDAQRAVDWIFTSDTVGKPNKIIYTCALNDAGGVEADLTVTPIESATADTGSQISPAFTGAGFYIVSGGASGYYTHSHIARAIRELGLRDVQLRDVTEQLSVLSVQGRQSRRILQALTDFDLGDRQLPLYQSAVLAVRTPGGPVEVRVMRVSFVGELGYEVHVAAKDALAVYEALTEAGGPLGMRDAGYRAMYALSNEKGYHLWNFDLRMDDTPLEAGLAFVCRSDGHNYKGRPAIERLRVSGAAKRLVVLDMQQNIPLWGLEGVYRDGQPVGHIRRAETAYACGDTMLGRAYVRRPDGGKVTNDYLLSGAYEVEVMGQRHPAKVMLKSPFDPENRRLMGDYSDSE